ncbi:MAG: phosphoglycerate dehydrogenase [Candidatus Obscuribacterales bacterium]|nr:phosphoglycerate dehydrogenase [Candidatus Obscuribacterales bacterium]
MAKAETQATKSTDIEVTTKRVLVADQISDRGLEILAERLDVTYDPKITAEKLLETIGEYDALLVRSRTNVTSDVIERGTKLKVIGRAGVGVDNIDVKSATEQGVLVVNSPEGNTASAAEHTLALMFSLARNVPAADASMKSGQWERSQFMGVELFNKVLGVIGLGKIGGRVAAAALALGMKVLVYDPFISEERAKQLNLVSVPLEEIWMRADFITIHTPKNAQTTNLINGTVLSRIKPGVRIINASRGGIIDEAALARAIKDGRVAGAALDVFDDEPPKDSALVELGSKVVLTPHLGASTVEAQFNVAIDLAEQIRDYLTEGMARSPVNLPFMRPDILKSLGKYLALAEAMGAIAGELAKDNVREFELIAYGSLANKATEPLVVAALKGMFMGKIEAVTFVNAQIAARNHGVQVRESRLPESNEYQEGLSILVSTDSGTTSISGTILAQHDPIITKINEHPINLTPAKYMLFTMHKDQPGMIAKVATVLGEQDINISTMSVGRVGIRKDAVMVLTMDEPLGPEVVKILMDQSGIHTARFVSLESMSMSLS